MRVFSQVQVVFLAAHALPQYVGQWRKLFRGLVMD